MASREVQVQWHEAEYYGWQKLVGPVVVVAVAVTLVTDVMPLLIPPSPFQLITTRLICFLCVLVGVEVVPQAKVIMEGRFALQSAKVGRGAWMVTLTMRRRVGGHS